MNRRLPPWAFPLAALLAISLAVSAAISLLTGGREISDDAANLLELSLRLLASGALLIAVLWSAGRAEARA